MSLFQENNWTDWNATEQERKTDRTITLGIGAGQIWYISMADITVTTKKIIIKITLMISASWSTPLSPGNKGWKNKNKNKFIFTYTKPQNQRSSPQQSPTCPSISSTNTPSCSIFSCSKYKLRCSIISRTYLWYIWFAFHLSKVRANKVKPPRQMKYQEEWVKVEKTETHTHTH